MRRKKRTEPAATPPADGSTQDWRRHLDTEERPNREDLARDRNVFTDTLLSPVPLPRWLRGRRRSRDKLS